MARVHDVRAGNLATSVALPCQCPIGVACALQPQVNERVIAAHSPCRPERGAVSSAGPPVAILPLFGRIARGPKDDTDRVPAPASVSQNRRS